MMKVLFYGWHLCSVFKMKANSAFKHQEYCHRGNIKERNHKTVRVWIPLSLIFQEVISRFLHSKTKWVYSTKKESPNRCTFLCWDKTLRRYDTGFFYLENPRESYIAHPGKTWASRMKLLPDTFILPGNMVVHRPWEQRERNEKCSMINQNPKSDFCSTKARRALYAHSPSHYSLKATEKHWEEFDYIQYFT